MEIEKFVINVGRQLGSGGRAIGHRLAHDFGMAYFDKEILSMAAQESGLCTEIFEKSDEHKGFFRTVFSSLFPIFTASGDLYGNQISDESLFRIQSEAIRKAAERESCVFIGRCADYVLRDMPRCVNIFISADTPDRVRRICELTKVDERTALKMIENGDEKRANYYNFYSSGTWGAADTYHLCINSSVLGEEATTEFIKEFVRQKLGLPPEAGRVTP